MKKLYVLFAFFLFLASALPGLAQAGEKRVLMVVTSADRIGSKPTGVWLEEFAVPYLLFQKAGYRVTVASVKGGQVPVDPRSLADGAKVFGWAAANVHLSDTVPLAQAKDAPYDAVFVSGGHGAVFDLPRNQDLKQLLGRLSGENKVIAAVCHGPAGLVGARKADGTPLVAGKTVTSFTDDEEKALGLDKEVPFLLESALRKEGAKFVAGKKWGAHAEVDGKLVTGQNPASSEATAKAVIGLLK